MKDVGNFDVVTFVKTSSQLNHHLNLFAIVGSIDKRIDDFGVVRNAIEIDANAFH